MNYLYWYLRAGALKAAFMEFVRSPLIHRRANNVAYLAGRVPSARPDRQIVPRSEARIFDMYYSAYGDQDLREYSTQIESQ